MRANRHHLYIDESGSGNFMDLRSKHPTLILTGLVLDLETDKNISSYFYFIKNKLLNLKNKPFHAYDIFENPKTKLSDARLKKLVKSLIEFLSLVHPIKLRIEKVDKVKLLKSLKLSRESFKDNKFDREIPYEALASRIFFWYSNFLAKENSMGSIVLESRRESDIPILRTYLRCTDESRFRTINTVKSATKMKRHVSSIRFETKTGLWESLEIADLISFVAFQHVHGTMRNFAKVELANLWKVIKSKAEGKKIYEPKSSDVVRIIGNDRVNRITKIVSSKSVDST